MLVKTSQEVLVQLVGLLAQLSPTQYAAPLGLLSKNSIGNHVRHIIEFWECQLKGIAAGVINYDARERNLMLETDPAFVRTILENLTYSIDKLEGDQEILLQVCYQHEAESSFVKTTVYRELAYNIEHTIHHLAIIKIAVLQMYPAVVLPPHFGVAHSTVRHRSAVAAQ
ncbi:MAG: DinB family protein [Bacteroidota bacterium]